MKKHDDTLRPGYLTPAELSAHWKITTMTLRRWRKEGKLSAHHIGRSIRFSLEEISRFEEESKV